MSHKNSRTPGQQHGPSRREFLTRAGLMAGGMALLGIPALRPALTEAALQQRTFTAGKFALDLDGQIVEMLKSAEGGFPKADVVSEAVAGPNQVAKKHIASIRYQDITIQCDPFMPRALSDWVNATLTMSHMRKSGAIVTADFNFKEQNRLQFTNAMLTEIGFPACDASSKEAGYLTLKLTPEFTKMQAGSGAAMKTDLSQVQHKTWLPANFRLNIQGVEQACKFVNKIEPLVIKQTIVQDQLGQMRDYQKQPGKLEFPNLVITLAEAQAAPFYAWFEDMVIKGNAGEDRERPGVLEFLSPDLKSVLFAINFSHLGIFSFAPEKVEANAETVRRVKVEMYCEQMTLTPTGKL